jgi:hypothetical protein
MLAGRMDGDVDGPNNNFYFIFSCCLPLTPDPATKLVISQAKFFS